MIRKEGGGKRRGKRERELGAGNRKEIAWNIFLGLTFDSMIEIPLDKISVFQDNLLTIAPNLSHIEIKEFSEGKYRIFLKKTSGCNISEIVNQLDKFVYNLFNGILQIEKNEEGNENKIMSNNKKRYI